MTSTTYVHGYTPREAQRLLDQAGTLAELFHHDTAYPAGSRVLEAGCGVGAQTVELARRSPGAEITAVVLSLPTTGPMLLAALKSQDMYLAGSFLMFLALMIVVGVLISDLALAALDPRIRLEGGGAR